MALGFNLMIEGQEGLTWARWERLARAAEDGGYEGLYRSDHLTGLFGDAARPRRSRGWRRRRGESASARWCAR
jgi:alkanesulfonate monooxygenase SsuD/methylene tetrahydromethanopterin reductase-like flavin-dependent oxidoreductase (luciferase family)